MTTTTSATPRGGTLSWKPVRAGHLYCAPACGGRCTWEAHLRAKSRARALAKLLGPGWTPKVYENLGWHYAVEKGGASFSEPTFSRKGALRRPEYMLIVNSVLGSEVIHGQRPREMLASAQREFAMRLRAAAEQVETIFSTDR